MSNKKIRVLLQWFYYPILVLYCCREITYLIAWTDRAPARAFEETARAILSPCLWSLTGITAVILILKKLQESRRAKERFPSALKRCLLQPGILRMCVFLAGIFLLETIGKTDMATFPLLLVYLAAYMPDRRTAFVLFCYFTSGIVFAFVTFMLGISKDIVVEFYYGVCHSFGFSNPNPAGMFIFFSFLLGWYLTGGKHKIRFFAAGTAIMIL